jgi:hypothetical protein
MLNIVDPTSTISRESAPFTLVGNRGELHEGNRIVRPASRKDWLYCVTSALTDPREFMSSGKFTDLFFLDEATALAAGHRPCGLCNRARFNQFVKAWKKVYDLDDVLAHEIDTELEIHRVRRKKQVTYLHDTSDLPSGVFVREVGRPDPLLLYRYEQPKRQEHWCVYPWSSHGYGVKEPRPEGLVEVLTPQPTVEVIRSGFTPDPVHPLLNW